MGYLIFLILIQIVEWYGYFIFQALKSIVLPELETLVNLTMKYSGGA